MYGRPSETGWEKLKRRMGEEPLVPLGCLATVGALVGGLSAFRRASDPQTQQRFMRMRVVAQGGTVLAMALGSVLAFKSSDAQQQQRQLSAGQETK